MIKDLEAAIGYKFQNIQLLQNAPATGNNNQRVTFLEYGVPAGNFCLRTVGNAGNQNVGLQLQLFQRLAAIFCGAVNEKFHGFCLTVCDGVHGNGGTGLVLHSTNIPDNMIAAQFFGVDQTAQ